MPLPHEENGKHTFIRQCWAPGWGGAKVTCAEHRGWKEATGARALLEARPPNGRAPTKSHNSGCRPWTLPHRQARATGYQGARGAPAPAEGGPGAVGSAEAQAHGMSPHSTRFSTLWGGRETQCGSWTGEQGIEGCGDDQLAQGGKMQPARGAKMKGQQVTASNVPPGPAW